MKSLTEAMVLAGTEVTAQRIERGVRESGCGLFAVVHSVDDAVEALAQGPLHSVRSSRVYPDVLLIDIAQMQAETPEAMAGLVRVLDVPVVYVAEHAEKLACPGPADPGKGAPLRSSLAPRELSLVIQLALCRRENERLRAWHGGIVSTMLLEQDRGTVPAQEEDVGPGGERWRHLLSSTPAVLYCSRASGDYPVTFISENVSALLGYHTQQLIRDPRFWLDHVHPDDRPRVLAGLRGMVESEPQVDEYRFLHRDGSYRWILDTRRLICEEGRPSMDLVGSWLDITERKQAEEALRASEERYKGIVGDQTELIVRCLPDGVLTFVNDAYCRCFDKRPEDLVGRSFMPLLPEEDQHIPREAFASLGLDNPVATCEHRVILPGGEIRWQSWTNRIILNSEGEIVEYQAVGRDVTERRLAEEALKQSEARYISIFQMAAVPIWENDISGMVAAIDELRAGGVTDFGPYFDEQPARAIEIIGKRRLININDEALRLFGAESKEEMARSFNKVFLPESVTTLIGVIVALAEGKRHFQGEIDICNLQGRRLTVLLRVSFPSRARKLESMLLSCVDISERKRAEDKITQLNEDLRRRATELEATNAELESFSYSVSHDLRAPLRAIDGFSRAVAEDYAPLLDDRGRDYLRRVRLASHRMSRLIDDLLALSRMTRSAMHQETFDLSAMAHEVIADLRKTQPERTVEVAIEAGMRVHADPNLLRVVLANLLGNAWKFTSKQELAHITMGTARREGRLAYFVADDGAGFDMSYVAKLFGAFQRLHHVSDFEGTGIGLATVRRIIRRHGGDIWAEGKVGEGATFTFTLS